MTNKEKSLLRQLSKQGKSIEEIKELVDCCDATIRRYIKAFNKKVTR